MHVFTLLLPLLAAAALSTDASNLQRPTGLVRHSQQPSQPSFVQINVVPMQPQHQGYWDFSIPAIWYPSFRLCTKAFRRVALAQGAYLAAFATYGNIHYDAVNAFIANYEKALAYAYGAHYWHNLDDDPVRRPWMAIRLAILDAEMQLMDEEFNHLPKENKLVKAAVRYPVLFAEGVVRVSKAAADLLVKAGKVAVEAAKAAVSYTVEALTKVAVTAAKVAVGVAYGAYLAVGGLVYGLYLGIKYAADLVKELARGVFKAAKYFYRNWFPIHYVPENEHGNKEKFYTYQTLVNQHYGGNWDRFYSRDSSGFSVRQCGDISDKADMELRQSYKLGEHDALLAKQKDQGGRPRKDWVDGSNYFFGLMGDPVDVV